MKKEERMSLKEANRLSIMKQIDKKNLTILEASRELSLTLRQTKRIRKRYITQGAKGLISLKKGKPSNRQIDKKVRKKIMKLMTKNYVNFGPTLAKEKLSELNKIVVSVETLRKWLIEEGVWKSKRKKEGKVFQRRVRRARFGEMVQGDGSFHDWFEGRGEKCCLIHFVDDATSKTIVGKFVEAETTEGYIELLQKHLERYGRPLGLYVDKHAIFRVNREELKKGLGITHFGQILKELGIELICANSPQAKGRIERKNGVFQDRLIKEMRLRNIKTIEEANQFLPEFIEQMNKRFGKEAASPEDAHRPLRETDNLDKIFARKDKRKLSKDLTMQHRGILYLIKSKTPNRLKHAYVEVFCRKDQPIEVKYLGVKLEYEKWSEKRYEQAPILDSKEIVAQKLNKTIRKPGKNHPWRR